MIVCIEGIDGAGKNTVKQSSKELVMERSRVKDFGTIHLGDQFVNDDSAYYEPVQYMSATEGTKPATIAVIPEGFTKEELPLYEQLALGVGPVRPGNPARASRTETEPLPDPWHLISKPDGDRTNMET